MLAKALTHSYLYLVGRPKCAKHYVSSNLLEVALNSGAVAHPSYYSIYTVEQAKHETKQ